MSVKKNEIQSYLNLLREKSRSDQVLTEDDIKQCLMSKEVRSLDIIGLWTYGDRINPSLSFSYDGCSDINNKIEFNINSTKIAERGLPKDLKSFRKLDYTISYENFTIYCDSMFDHEKVLRFLLECLSIIASSSSNSINIAIKQNNRIENIISNIVRPEKNKEYKVLLCSSAQSIAKFLKLHYLIIKVITSNDNSSDFNSFTEIRHVELNSTCQQEVLNEYKNIFELLKSSIDTLNKSYQEEITATVKIGTKSVIIQPMFVGGELAGERYFCVFYSTAPYKKSVIHGLSSFATRFAHEYKQMRKIQLLSEAIPHVEVSKTLIGRKEIKDSFDAYFNKHADKLFSILNCHSVTLRFLNPAINRLDVYVSANSFTGQYDPNNESSSASQEDRYSLSSYRNSVNVFTYLIASDKMPYVYLRNLSAQSIPSEYSSIGLLGVYKARKESKSEICLPFRFGSIPIGTLNIESSEKNAFEEDIEFILAFKHLLERRYKNYFEVSDIDWHKLLTRFADPLHELKNYLATDIFDENQKELLKNLFMPDSTTKKQSTEPKLSMYEIPKVYKKWVLEYFNKESEYIVNDVLRIVEFNFAKDSLLSRATFDAVTTILKNLVKNIEDHSDIREDKVIVSTTARYRSNNEEEPYIRIRMKTYGFIEDKILNLMCLKPIFRENSKHYGMYILSLMTRSCGGYVNVEKSKVGFPIYVEFYIPTH